MSAKNSAFATRQKIQDCAINLFQQYGYDNVTVMQICNAVGITKRTFYYHYSSKDELLDGLTDYMGYLAERLLASLAEQQTNVGILWTLMSVYSINSAKLGPAIIRQIYIRHIRGDTPENFPYSTYLYKTVVKTLENAKLSKEITNPSASENLAFTLYHCFRSVVVTWASTNGTFDLSEAFRTVFSTTLGVDPDSF